MRKLYDLASTVWTVMLKTYLFIKENWFDLAMKGMVGISALIAAWDHQKYSIAAFVGLFVTYSIWSVKTARFVPVEEEEESLVMTPEEIRQVVG